MDNKEIVLKQANDIAYSYAIQDKEDFQVCCYLNKDYVENVGISNCGFVELFEEIINILNTKYDIKANIKGIYILNDCLHISIFDLSSNKFYLSSTSKFSYLKDIYITYYSVTLEESRVFLGGTCGDTDWRKPFIDNLSCKYFNPIVDDWNDAKQQKEIEEKALCNIHFYHINHEMAGVYSIAEIIESCFIAKKVVIYINFDGFSEGQKRSLKAVENMAQKHGAIICSNFDDAVSRIETI